MRLSTKLGASFSAAALSSAFMLGGAGIAQAQSLGSLGSSAPDGVDLTVDGDTEGVAGTITNNTEDALTCGIAVSDADVISDIEAAIDDETTYEQAVEQNQDALDAANAEGKNALASATVPAGETVDWTGVGSYGPEEDFVAGAAANCGDGTVGFAYESAGVLGSLDMGSLGS